MSFRESTADQSDAESIGYWSFHARTVDQSYADKKQTQTETKMVVSDSNWVLGWFIGMLGAFLENEYKLLKEVRDEIIFLKAELEAVNAFMQDLPKLEMPSALAKDWVMQVRELVSDMADSIYKFEHRIETESATPGELMRFIDKSKRLMTTANTLKRSSFALAGKRKFIEMEAEVEAAASTSDCCEADHAVAEHPIVAKLEGLQGELESVKTELEDLYALLAVFDELEAPDPQVKEWSKDLMELLSDHEDSIADSLQEVQRVKDSVIEISNMEKVPTIITTGGTTGSLLAKLDSLQVEIQFLESKLMIIDDSDYQMYMLVWMKSHANELLSELEDSIDEVMQNLQNIKETITKARNQRLSHRLSEVL